MHVKARQDNIASFDKLSQKAQLNCTCNHATKKRIAVSKMEGAILGRLFPLEPIGIFINGKKMKSKTGNQIQFWAHQQLARTFYQDQKILSHTQFDSIDRN